MNFNVICGLPRSGSTLLCELLNQRNDSFASSTSSLPLFIQGILSTTDNNEALLSDLANIPGTDKRIQATYRAIVETWYSDYSDKVIFDKGRGWAHMSVLLRSIYPDSTIIATVRDPREVLASIEKQHRKTGEFGGGTLYDRCSQFMSPDGLVGTAIRGVEDLIRRNYDKLILIDYNAFVADPLSTLKSVEKEIGLEAFDYDIVNIDSTSTDLDAQWKFKFNHKIKGPVGPNDSKWEDYISKDIAELSMLQCPFYNKILGYGE